MTVLDLLISSARAAPTVVVLAGPLPDAATVLGPALGAEGDGEVWVVDPGEAVAEVELRSVVGRLGDGDCGGPVALSRWRADTDRARAALQRLDFASALDLFVQLELEMACLQGVPGASDLVRVELGLAAAHHYSARSAGADLRRRAFHETETRVALARAAAWSRGLSLPPDVDPELAPALEAAREEGGRGARVILAGPGTGEGARLNGRPAGAGVVELAGGAALVQLTRGIQVEAAALVTLPSDGPTLLWLAPGGRPLREEGLVQDVEAWQRGAETEGTEARLAALLDALGGEGPALLVTTDPQGWTAWTSTGAGLARGPAGPSPRGYRPWRWAWGAGVGLGGSTLGARSLGGEVGEALDGLGGVGPGLSAWGRWKPVDELAVVLTASPWTVTERLPVAQGGGTLFRGVVPARFGARWTPAAGLLDLELGADLGVHWLGDYDGQRAAPVAALAGGVAGPVGRDARMRGEVHAGVAYGYLFGGLLVGLEGVR